MSEELTEAEIKKIIREEIEPKLQEIMDELDTIEWTPEMEEEARKISYMSWEDWYKPFTI